MLNPLSEKLTFLYTQFQLIYYNERVQTMLGITHLAFGIHAAHHLIQTYYFAYRTIPSPHLSSQQHQAIKMMDTVADISRIANALVNWPLSPLWRWTAQRLLSSAQIERFFGSSTALSPSRIQLVVGLASLILSLPSNLKTAYFCYLWAFNRRRYTALQPIPAPHAPERTMRRTSDVASQVLFHLSPR
ncbi:hypothetical protein [Candidatus Protochlamydia phocaeensis]|uniref:hypothetical protein n=1 Tax=Candidatus Protochlamydia phocaeensis TaxID=1414722 RepID=UPI00083947C7|nr:hypothetical protein [Candidatus Protochlamydia phocaeensis]